MDTQTTLDNGKLNAYYFATRSAVICIEERIAVARQRNWSTEYDEYQLKTLQDMEQFFKMSWDCWMEQLVGHKMEEVTHG